MTGIEDGETGTFTWAVTGASAGSPCPRVEAVMRSSWFQRSWGSSDRCAPDPRARSWQITRRTSVVYQGQEFNVAAMPAGLRSGVEICGRGITYRILTQVCP